MTAAWGTRPVVYAGQGTKGPSPRSDPASQRGSATARHVRSHRLAQTRRVLALPPCRGGAIGPDGAAPTLRFPGRRAATGLRLANLPKARTCGEPCAPEPRRPEPGSCAGRVSAVAGRLSCAALAEALPVDLSLFLAGSDRLPENRAYRHRAGALGTSLPREAPAGELGRYGERPGKAGLLAKDAVFVVDDFAPGGTVADVQRLHREADRLLRAQGTVAAACGCPPTRASSLNTTRAALSFRPARTFREASHFAPGCSSP